MKGETEQKDESSKSIVTLGSVQPDNVDTSTTNEKKVLPLILDILKYTYSSILLVFATVIVHASIFTNQTVGVKDNGIPATAAFFIIWFLIVWLAVMEGGQGVLVGLQHVSSSNYVDSHPLTLKNTKLAHKGDNMGRFIIGRQFLTFLVIFLINLMGSASTGAQVLGLPQILNDIFLANGVAMILFVVCLGQLTSQVNAAKYMCDFINNRFMLYGVTYVALAIEVSGLLHFVYLVQLLFLNITGQTIESKEPARSTLQNFFFWGRASISFLILGYSFAVILEALFNGQTAVWEGIPPYVSVILFFTLMCLVGMMEGMQIALFAVIKMPESQLSKYSVAKANCELTFRANNLESFLIGRQICVTLCMFVVARIIAIDVKETEENIFGASDSLQEFFDTGILGALITTMVASLIWRIIASSFPLAFLSNPLIYVIIRTCLFFDATGICSASILVAKLQAILSRYKPDSIYIDENEMFEDGENRRAAFARSGSVYSSMIDVSSNETKLRKALSFHDPTFVDF